MMVLQANKQPLMGVEFSPDGTLIATCGQRGELRLWDLSRRRERWRRPTNGWGKRLIAFIADGRTVICGHSYGLWLWQTHSGRGERFAELPLNTYGFVAVSPGARHLLITGWSPGQWLQCWSWDERKSLWQLQGDWSDLPSAAAFSPDGQTFAAGDHFCRVRLRDLATGDLKHTLVGHSRPISSIAYSPDGKSLAWLAGTRLCVWELDPPHERINVHTGRHFFTALAFHPSGEMLLTASNDGTIRTWDTATWRERDTFNWHVGEVKSVAVSPDGLRAACGGSSGKLVIWDVDM